MNNEQKHTLAFSHAIIIGLIMLAMLVGGGIVLTFQAVERSAFVSEPGEADSLWVDIFSCDTTASSFVRIRVVNQRITLKRKRSQQ